MKIVYVLVFVMLLCACDTEKRRMNKAKREWLGKEIQIPGSLQAKILDRDTVCYELFEKKHKVLMYVDSTGCSECKLQLYHWSKLITEANTFADSVAFIIVAHVVNPKVISILCEQNQFIYPVFFDKRGEMGRLNEFVGNTELQTFLLDRDNRVMAVGNPVNSPLVWEKYLNIIQN